MNILYTRYSFVFALLLATTFSASAEPGHSKGGGVVRALNNNRQAEHKEVQIHRQEEKKINKEVVSESSVDDPGEAKKNSSRLDGKAAISQKRSRLTADERRALRRQIQDAGQELYVPAK
ncbi:hypothetical protein AAKU64_003736 [Undibacterium sp. GrIS 1.8]|uniref:hypothetical protein n=1 Tax=unclassified Undibacterium TaxID=2630295 RepID=UPI00339949F5